MDFSASHCSILRSKMRVLFMCWQRTGYVIPWNKGFFLWILWFIITFIVSRFQPFSWDIADPWKELCHGRVSLRQFVLSPFTPDLHDTSFIVTSSLYFSHVQNYMIMSLTVLIYLVNYQSEIYIHTHMYIAYIHLTLNHCMHTYISYIQIPTRLNHKYSIEHIDWKGSILVTKLVSIHTRSIARARARTHTRCLCVCVCVHVSVNLCCIHIYNVYGNANAQT